MVEGLQNIEVTEYIDLAFRIRAEFPSLGMEVVAKRLQGTCPASFHCNSSYRAINNDLNPYRRSPFEAAFMLKATVSHTFVIHKMVIDKALNDEHLEDLNNSSIG